MEFIPLYWAIPLFMSLVLIEIIHEFHNGHKTHRFNSTLANLSVGVVEMIVGASSHLLILFFYILVFEHWAFVKWEPSPLMWCVGLLAYEVCYYWKHRLAHEVNLLWGAHIVHHQSEDMNFSTATRLSATSSIWGVFFYMPIALLGITPFVFMVVKALTLTYQFFIHTEHISRLPRWFEFIFNTPSHHRVHHAYQEQYLDKNYGSLLIIWDRIFGTFAEEKEKPVYGTLKKLDSWNPVEVNISYYRNIASWISKSTSIKDKLRVIFGRSDMIPEYLIEDSNSQDHNGRDEKYNAGSKLSKAISIYVLIQFIMILSLAFLLLFFYHDLNWWEVVLVTFWALMSLNLLGQLLQGKRKSVFWMEIGKHISLFLILAVQYIWGSLILANGLALCIFPFCSALLWIVVNASEVAFARRLKRTSPRS
ncbi:MAG: sterol desaturase family protein [Bacteroidota bacterium]